MKRFDRKSFVTAVSLGAAALVAGFSCLLHFGRLASERSLAEEQAAFAMRAGQEAVPPPAPGDEPAPRRWQLPNTVDVAGTLQILQELGDAAGVEFSSAKAAVSGNSGSHAFVVSGTAGLQQVCEFVASIERHERLIVVESGSVLPAAEGRVAFEFGLATFHTGGER